MIPFNIFGHSNTAGDNNEDPIIWVDSSDSSSYALSGNDVTALMNKGSLGGAMTLNGTVKFANSGFESWSNSDYITRDLGEPFMNDNSFTIVTTFDLQDITSGNYSDRNMFSQLRIDNFNNAYFIRGGSLMYDIDYRNSTSPIFETSENYQLGVQTMIYSYDVNTGATIKLMSSGNEFTFSYTNAYIGTTNAIVKLLQQDYLNANSGANNPLHEFRLYDRAFTLTQMQTLQTELNNKYTP